ncbi:MAG: flagellar hook-associated protein FlgK [Pseudomonadota bacterium]
MSLSAALNLSLSGLTASARAAATTSENIANAATPGYGRRSIDQVSGAENGVSLGVQVREITRAEAPVLTQLRRDADADAAASDLRQQGLINVERAIGKPGDVTAFPAQIAALESAFAALAATPESASLQTAVANQLSLLVQRFHAAEEQLGTVRESADRQIATAVATLGDSLQRISDLNIQITAFQSSGRDVGTLLDQRDGLIDTVNRIVPVQVVPREGEQVSLYSTGGVVLLDTRPATLSFTPTPTIPSEARGDGGIPASLLVNGREIDMTRGTLGGGTLGAAFALRDEDAVVALAGIDALAADIATRLEAADTTRAATAPGLLADRNSAINLNAVAGLAGRLTLNPLVDVSEGGALWRLRDGLGTAAPQPSATARLPNALLQSLREAATAPDGLPDAAKDSAGHAAQLANMITGKRLASEDASTAASAGLATLSAEERDAVGVNTDTELQTLLSIEAAYEANARVLSVLRTLYDTLLEI